jgi:hypothetical protein
MGWDEDGVSGGEGVMRESEREREREMRDER